MDGGVTNIDGSRQRNCAPARDEDLCGEAREVALGFTSIQNERALRAARRTVTSRRRKSAVATMSSICFCVVAVICGASGRHLRAASGSQSAKGELLMRLRRAARRGGRRAGAPLARTASQVAEALVAARVVPAVAAVVTAVSVEPRAVATKEATSAEVKVDMAATGAQASAGARAVGEVIVEEHSAVD
eukprot:7381572-Prymnesium_polylepis.1